MESFKLINKPSEEINLNEKSDIHNDISTIIIPFSKVFKNKRQLDIYSGNEKIPFKERDPEYKIILRQEFANNFNFEFKVFRSVIKFPSF